MSATWICRLRRRRDGKKYYYRHDGCTTARKESSMRMDEATARQLATAISTHHKDFYAWAVPYNARHPKRRIAAAAAARLSEAMLDNIDSVACELIKERKD